MPPKSFSRKGKSRATDQPAIPIPSTINLIPIRTPGHSIQTSLYYNSQSWLSILDADIESLFSSFERAYQECEGEEAFEAFKKCWEEGGWVLVHILGVTDGPGREPWAKSVLRAFLTHLKPDSPPLKQLTAIFAIYCFWATQNRPLDRAFISLDAGTLDHLLSLPTALPLALSPSLTLDLTQILYTLTTSAAFFLVPTSYPPTPSVSIIDASSPSRTETAKRLLGLEEELSSMTQSRLLSEDDDDDEPWDSSRGWSSHTDTHQSSYLLSKSLFLPRPPSFRHSILSSAEDLTLRALKDARQVATGVVPAIATWGDEKGAEGLGLFELVGGEKGLKAFEETMKGLQGPVGIE